MIKKLIHFIFVLLLLALIIGIPGAWMLQRSYSDPEVHYYYTKEGEGDQSLRFVVLSDLYGYVFEDGNGVIADRAGNTFPDAILIGGNMITAGTEELTPLTDLIKRLVQIAPVYYSYGEEELKYVKNHTSEKDSTDPLREALEKAGAVVLNESYADTNLYGIGVRVGGMYNNAYELTNLRNEVKKGMRGPGISLATIRIQKILRSCFPSDLRAFCIQTHAKTGTWILWRAETILAVL